MKKFNTSIFMMDSVELYDFFTELDIVYDRFTTTSKKLHGTYNYKNMRLSLLELYSTCNHIFIEDLVFDDIEIYYNLLDAYRILKNMKCNIDPRQVMKLLFDEYDRSKYIGVIKYNAHERIEYYCRFLANLEL